MEKLVNYYDVLEINENASDEVIKAAYRALAKKYHPDSYKGSSCEREKNMALINSAFDTLSDSQKRANYDQKLKSEYYQQQENKKTDKDESSEDLVKEEIFDDIIYESEIKGKVYSERNESSLGNKIGKIICTIGKEIVGEMQRNSQLMENAYLDGLNMDEARLVRKFMQSRGYIRTGYAKAMEEKGLLYRNAEGKYEPTYLLKKYL